MISIRIVCLFFLSLAVASEATDQPKINVRLKEGVSINDFVNSFRPVSNFYKTFSLPEETLDAFRVKGNRMSGRRLQSESLPDLNLWYSLELLTDAVPEEALAEAQANEYAEVAELVAVTPPPPPGLLREKNRRLQSSTPNFESNQGYLDPAPNGIDARFAWTQAGGTGTGVKIYDIEYGWNLNHEDLGLGSVPVLVPAGQTQQNPFSDNHGTAVLGEMVGTNNGNGVKGIAFNAAVGLAAEYSRERFSIRGEAILQAVNNGNRGDVILLEMQTGACNIGPCSGGSGCGPAEAEQTVFDATVTATANGFIVVAAGGNGDVNLDQPACGGIFNRNIRDSGAIIVGAGQPPTSALPRGKESFSSYGSRMDLQGWGNGIYSTGYGSVFQDPGNAANEDRWYTSNFAGTSGASPIVAGAAALLQSYAKSKLNRVLTPAEVRNVRTFCK